MARSKVLEATSNRKHFHALLNISSVNKENKSGCNINTTAQDEILAPHKIAFHLRQVPQNTEPTRTTNYNERRMF
jgi:hypothetical protein